MAFKIDGASGFISKLSKEGARAALFEVTCALKGVNVDTADGDGNSLLKYMCKGVQIPTNQVGIAQVNYFGRPVKYPGNRTFDDLTLTIINDEGYAVRNRIENWMDRINSIQTNKRHESMPGKNQYTSDLILDSLTKDGKVASGRSWIFRNCFPTSLDQVDLAWDTNDSIMEFTTTWSYDYWEHGNATGGRSSGPGGP